MGLTLIKYKFNYYSILLLAFVIPLERRLIAPATIIFVISSFINFKKNNLKNLKTILYFGLIYVLYLVGLSYTEKFSLGLTDLTIKLPLVLIPICFFIANLNFKEITYKALNVFTIGCITAFIFSLVNSLALFFGEKDYSLFFYDKIGFFTHPSYIAMMCSFSIIYLYYILLTKRDIKKFNLTIIISFISLLSIYILLLVSKTGLITMIITHLGFIFYTIVKQKKYLVGISILFIFCLSFTLAFNGSKKFKSRILEVSSITTSKTSSTSARSIIWSISLNLIKEKPLLGYGTGNEKSELVKRYNKSKNTYLVEQKLNAHNQFLQTSLAIGIIGGFLLLLMIIIPSVISLKEKNYLYLFFLIIININFLTESMLERQVGVIFYSFFNCLLFSFFFSNKIPSNK